MPTINRTILMSDALHFSVDQPINPYYYEHSVNSDLAQREHEAVAAAFRRAGIEVVSTASPSTSQDGVYTANWALVRGDTAILARLPEVRASEEAYAEKVLTDLGKKVIHVPAGLKFSGQGDALACGDYLFCGSVYRSDVEAQAFAAEALGYERIQLQTAPQINETGLPVINAVSGWPDSFFYDIDLALSVIKHPANGEKGLIAYCPEAFTPESQAILEAFSAVDKITVSVNEAKQGFAMNLVSTGESVVLSAHAPVLQAELERRGLTVYTPEITELAKGGGYIRCVGLTLD